MNTRNRSNIGSNLVKPPTLANEIGIEHEQTLSFMNDLNNASARGFAINEATPGVMRSISSNGSKLICDTLQANTPISVAAAVTFMQHVDLLESRLAAQVPEVLPIKFSLRPSKDAIRVRESSEASHQTRVELHKRLRAEHDPSRHDNTTIDAGLAGLGLQLAKMIRDGDSILQQDADERQASFTQDRGEAGQRYAYHIVCALNQHLDELTREEGIALLDIARQATSLGVTGSVKVDQVSRAFAKHHGIGTKV